MCGINGIFNFSNNQIGNQLYNINLMKRLGIEDLMVTELGMIMIIIYTWGINGLV